MLVQRREPDEYGPFMEMPLLWLYRAAGRIPEIGWHDDAPEIHYGNRGKYHTALLL